MDHRLQIILAAKDISNTTLTKFRGSLGAITKSVFSLRGAIGTLAGTGGFGLLVTSSLKTADALAKTADKLGISTGALQEYQYAANMSGVNTETLNMALQRFTRRTAEAAQGKGELKGVLEQYNIQVKDAAGNTRRTEDVLSDLADVIQRTESRSERLRIAFKAFDSEGAALVNMLKDGGAGLDEFRRKANDLGLVIKDSLIRDAEKAGDNLSTIGKVLKTQITSAVVTLAPKITEISGSMLRWVEANQELIKQDIPEYLGQVAGALATIAKYAGLRSVFNTFGQGAELAAKGMIDWDAFVSASFIARQKMVDDALKQLKTLTIEGDKITGKIGPSTPGYDLYINQGQKPPPPKSTPAPPPAGGAGTSAPPVAGVDYGFLGRTDSAYRMSRAGGVVERMGSIEAQQAAALERMTSVNEQAYDSMDAHVTAYYDNLEAQQKKSFNTMIELTEKTAWSMQDTFSDVFFDAMDGKLENLSDYFKAILNSIKRSIADIASQSLVQNLFGDLSKSGGGGGLISKIFYPDKSMASGGYLGEGVRGFGVKTGQSYEFHPNEYVTPANKIGGGVKVDVNVVNNLGQEAQVRKTTSWVSADNMVADIILNKKLSSRSFRREMS